MELWQWNGTQLLGISLIPWDNTGGSVCLCQSYSQYILPDQMMNQIFTQGDANRFLKQLCQCTTWGFLLGRSSVESYEERKVATVSRREMCFLDKLFWVCCLHHTIRFCMEAQFFSCSLIAQKLWDKGDVTVPDYIKT